MPLAFSGGTTGKCKKPGARIKKKKQPKLVAFFFLLSPTGSCILRWAHLKMQAAGGDNINIKGDQLWLFFLFYCPQPLAFSARPTRKCKRLGSTIEKEKTVQVGHLFFSIVAPSGLHFQIGPPENGSGWGHNRKIKDSQNWSPLIFLLLPPTACIFSYAHQKMEAAGGNNRKRKDCQSRSPFIFLLSPPATCIFS